MDGHADDLADGRKAQGKFIKNLSAETILRTMHRPLVVLDEELIVHGASEAFYKTFEVRPDETEGAALYDLGNGQWNISELRELLANILPNSGMVTDFMVEHNFENIGQRIMMINARQIAGQDPKLMLLEIDDVTGREDLRKKEMKQQKDLAEITIDAAPVSFLVLGHDLRVIRANETFYNTFGVEREGTNGRLVYELGNHQWDIPKLRILLEDVLPDNEAFNSFEVEHDFEDIGHRIMLLNARRINSHQLILLAIDDLTEKRARELEQSQETDRHEFILDLLDRLKAEQEPETLIDVTCEALGQQSGADLVIYADIDESDGYRIRPRLWGKDAVPAETGHRQVVDFGQPLLDHAKGGKTLVIENVDEDTRVAAGGPLAAFREIGVVSSVHVPLVEEGQLRAILGIQCSRPRQWTQADIKLTEEVAERLWDAIRRARAEAKLLRSLEKFRVLVETGAQATWDMNPDGANIIESTSWCSYTGQTAEEARGSGWLNAIHPDDRQSVTLLWAEHLQTGEPLSGEYRLRHGDGWRWSRVRAAPVQDANGRIVQWAGMNQDITERKETERRIEHMALYDALTGLPNRTLLQDRFREAAARTLREGSQLGLIMLDVDRFKEVNDSVGHAAGDETLRSIADRGSRALRSTDTFARLSGDEFVAVLPNVGGVAEIEILAERIRDAISQPLTLDGQSVTLSASMGIAVFPQNGEKLELLLHGSDIALYRAKTERRGTIRFFEPEMEAEAQRLRQTEAELRVALERGELTLYYQPQRDLSDGRIRSVEALVRWRHPIRGLLLPGEFIAVAESTGLIHELGCWVLNEACRQIRDWRDRGLDLRVGINISAAEARFMGVLETLDQAFSAYNLCGNDVEIELTETLLVDPSDGLMCTLLKGLQERGVCVALDDFGTGYSSLSYLKDLPINTIKIDRSFIAGTDTGDGQILLEAMIDLGRKLGKKIVAEGVETDEQLDWLLRTGCDTVQGFLIARPLPPDQILTNLT